MIPAIIAAVAAAASAAKAYNDSQKAKAEKNSALNAAKTTLKETKNVAESKQNALKSNADSALETYGSIYGDVGSAKENLDQALSDFYGLTPYEASEFSYDKDISDFYDPAFNLSVNMANDGIQNSRALGGGLFSSATADALSAQNNVLATNMFNDASNAMNADKSLAQSIWSGNEAAKQAAVNSAQNLASTKLGAAQNTASQLANAYGDYYKNVGNAESGYYDDLENYWQVLAGIEAQKQNEASLGQRALGIATGGIFG